VVIKVRFSVQKSDHVSYGRPRPLYRPIYKMFIHIPLEIFVVEQQKCYLLKRVYCAIGKKRFISNRTGDALQNKLHLPIKSTAARQNFPL